MYEVFFDLDRDPFRLLPDPGCFYPHASCAKALAYLRYALEHHEGMVVITGPPGSGKSTLAGQIVREVDPNDTTALVLVATDLDAIDLLRRLADTLDLPSGVLDRAALVQRLQERLAAQRGATHRVVLILDEAHSLSAQTLETLRLLTDLQPGGRPVLQLFLLGDLELESILKSPAMQHLQQRVVANCRLLPMSLVETRNYLEYRLVNAGWRGDPAFGAEVVKAIYRYSQGQPRYVNKIASRLLLHASADERHALDDDDVRAIIGDLQAELLAPLDANGRPAAPLEEPPDAFIDLALVPDSPYAEPTVAPRDQSQYDPLRRDPLLQDVVAAAGISDMAPASNAPMVRTRDGTSRGGQARRGRSSLRLAQWPAALRARVVLMTAALRRRDHATRHAQGSAQGSLGAAPARPRAAAPGRRHRGLVLAGVGTLAAGLAALLVWLAAGPLQLVPVPALAHFSDVADVDVETEPAPGGASSAPTVLPAPPLDRPAPAPGGAWISAAPDRPPGDPRTKVEITAGREGRVAGGSEDEMALDAVEVAFTALATATGTGGTSPYPVVSRTLAAMPGNERPAAPEQRVDAAPAPQAEIDHLLALGQQALERDRLSIPRDDNAHDYFRRVLALQPGNAAAEQGLDRIVQRYGELAANALERQSLDEAERFIERARQVDPKNQEILALRARLANRVAAAQAPAGNGSAALADAQRTRAQGARARARQAAEDAEPAPGENFIELMRQVDGG